MRRRAVACSPVSGSPFDRRGDSGRAEHGHFLGGSRLRRPSDQPDGCLMRLLALVLAEVHVVLVAAALPRSILVAEDRIVVLKRSRRVVV
jgi:hypothetical protein